MDFKMAGGILLTLGAAAGISIAGSKESNKTPDHLERISFLRENLRDGRTYQLTYSPFFNIGAMQKSEDILATFAVAYGGHVSTALVGLDQMPDDDGTVDYGALIQAHPEGKRICLIPDEELGEELEATFDEHYELSTDAWYRLFTEKNRHIKGALGQDELQEMQELCKGRWQVSEEDFLTNLEEIPSHIERIEYLERNLGGLKMGVEGSDLFDDSIFVYDNGRGNADLPGEQTQYGTLYVMLQKSNGERPLDFWLLSIRDLPITENDGTIDKVVLIRYNAKTGEDWDCDIWRYQINDDELVEKLDQHYEEATEGAYLGLTEGAESYETIIGKGDFEDLADICGH